MNTYLNNAPVAVLLSTYNGEKYVAELLDSLVRQTFQNFSLYIRDDGSTDKTLQIISEYCDIHDHFFLISDSENLGAAASFMSLLHAVQSEYYMYADQDDVWLPEKIRKAYYLLTSEERKKPQIAHLVCADAVVTNSELEMLYNSFIKISGINPDFFEEKGYVYVTNISPGCTYIFNRTLRDHLLYPALPLPMHDWWTVLNAYKYGNIHFINSADIFYRQHANNVIGTHEKNIFHGLYRIANIRLTIRNQMKQFQFLKRNGFIKSISEYYYYKLMFNFRSLLK